MKVAVLGASGEIGTYIVRHLYRRGQTVLPIVRKSLGPVLSRYKLKPIITDFYNQQSLCESIKYADVVVNCVVDKGIGKSATETIRSNILIAKNISSVLKISNVKRFIHLSSIAVLPPRLNSHVLSKPFQYSLEKDQYTNSKIQTEKIFIANSNQVPTVIMRPGIVYGPMLDWSILAFNKVQSGDVTLPDYINTCYAVHVIDLARLIEQLLLFSIKNTNLIYGINPEQRSWTDFYNYHAEAIGISNKVRVIPPWILEKIYYPNNKQKIVTSISKIFNHKIVGRPLRSPLIHKVGKIMVTKYFSEDPTVGDRTSIGTLPNKFDFEFYQSFGQIDQFSEIGQSIGFKYEINLERGVKNAAAWYQYKITKPIV